MDLLSFVYGIFVSALAFGGYRMYNLYSKVNSLESFKSDTILEIESIRRRILENYKNLDHRIDEVAMRADQRLDLLESACMDVDSDVVQYYAPETYSESDRLNS